LAIFLDRPTIPWKTVIIGFGIAQYAFESYISVRQHRKLQETKVPKALEGAVTQEVYDKAQASILIRRPWPKRS
jgi:STE24 endopeptidase